MAEKNDLMAENGDLHGQHLNVKTVGVHTSKAREGGAYKRMDIY